VPLHVLPDMQRPGLEVSLTSQRSSNTDGDVVVAGEGQEFADLADHVSNVLRIGLMRALDLHAAHADAQMTALAGRRPLLPHR